MTSYLLFVTDSEKMALDSYLMHRGIQWIPELRHRLQEVRTSLTWRAGHDLEIGGQTAQPEESSWGRETQNDE